MFLVLMHIKIDGAFRLSKFQIDSAEFDPRGVQELFGNIQGLL
jgi:hypothetical protein